MRTIGWLAYCLVDEDCIRGIGHEGDCHRPTWMTADDDTKQVT